MSWQDFSIVSTKLERAQYRSPSEFVSDIKAQLATISSALGNDSDMVKGSLIHLRISSRDLKQNGSDVLKTSLYASCY